jgi:hypothetical protein
MTEFITRGKIISAYIDLHDFDNIPRLIIKLSDPETIITIGGIDSSSIKILLDALKEEF